MKLTNSVLMYFLVVILIYTLITTSLVLAQNVNEPTGFQNVQLWLYPEYDDPRLLVMLEGEIVGAQPPALVRFLVPSAAEMYSAGSIDAMGQYSGGPPRREPSSIPGWDEISYEVKTDTFRVEYYDPIIIGQPEKSISYQFLWYYPITGLEVIIQEPRLAENFMVLPSGRAFVDDAGFTSYIYYYPMLANERLVQFDIAYTKSNTTPSLFIEDEGISSTLLAMIVLIILIIVIIGILLWRRKSKPINRMARRRLTRNEARNRLVDNKPKTRFCPQCGKPLESLLKFCPHCGAEL